MTSEEIKQSKTMAEVVREYGITIDRKGFVKCPFHNEKTASMKIYKDSYYCFGCHESGDIFTFVQKMDNCDFKTAFISLGGIYEDMTDNAKYVANIKRERERSKREQEEIAEKEFKKELSLCIEICRQGQKILEPYSDDWCVLTDNLPILLDAWENKTNGEEINRFNVYRICKRVRRTLNP